MTITERITELSNTRKQLQSVYANFSHLDGKHCSRNQAAFQSLHESMEFCTALMPQDFIGYKNSKKVFDFSGLQSSINTTQQRIHQLDTIDTLDLTAYIEAVKAVTAEREAIQAILKGEHYQIAKQELDKLTGYNL